MIDGLHWYQVILRREAIGMPIRTRSLDVVEASIEKALEKINQVIIPGEAVVSIMRAGTGDDWLRNECGVDINEDQSIFDNEGPGT